MLDKGIDTSVESSASGMYGTAINCANTVSMAALLIRNGMRPSLSVEDEMKNPVFKRLYMDNNVMFGFWFDFEMQILTDDVKEILVQMVREHLEEYMKEELLEFVDSYEDFFYYKYCEEEWEIWNIKEKELTNLLLRTNEKLKSKKMLPVYRYEIFNSTINVLKKIRNNQKEPKWLFNVYVRDYFTNEEMKAIHSYINENDSLEFCEHIRDFSWDL